MPRSPKKVTSSSGSGHHHHNGQHRVSTLPPPPISGIGVSADALVFMFPLLNRLVEKGAVLPFRFPDTVCYEHHFPRGWFSVEKEAKAAAAMRRAAAASNTDPVPLEQLKKASTFLKVDAPSRREESSSRGGDERLILVRRVAKECDSGIIRKAFSSTSASPHMAAMCVSRHPDTDEVRLQYLDDPTLADMLMASPETCLLSKMVPSGRPKFDVLVATWTPSVFSVEHRQNRHMSHDTDYSVQERGDITTPSEYQELHCSSLTAQRIRDQLFAFMACVANIEKKHIGELRAYFRTDHKERLWFLFCDVCRFATPRATPGLQVMVKGGEDPGRLWDRIEREVEWRKESERERSAAARIVGPGPAQDRGPESEYQKLHRLSIVHYGRHPSFARLNDPTEDADPEDMAIVEKKLRQMIMKAKGKSTTPSRSPGAAARGGKAMTPIPVVGGNRFGLTLGGRPIGSSESSNRLYSPPRDRGGKSSYLSEQYYAGSSYAAPSASDGLIPMVPLSMQPALISFNSTLGSQTSGEATTSPSSRRSPANHATRGNGSRSVRMLDTDILEASSTSAHDAAGASILVPEGTYVAFAASQVFALSPTNTIMSSSATTLGSPVHQTYVPEYSSAELNAKRKSFVRIAPRPQSFREGRPSKWMKAVVTIERVNSMMQGTPRRSHSEMSSRGSSRGGGDRSRSFTSPGSPQNHRGSKTSDDGNDEGDLWDEADMLSSIRCSPEGGGIRQFVPGKQRLQRARASVVLSRQADLLDISSRLDYNELKRVHDAAIAELDDIHYFAASEELKTRESIPIVMDLPRGLPDVPDDVMCKIGFSLVKNDPDMDRMFLERYFFMSHTVHVGWMFDHLKAILEDVCYEAQLRFWQGKAVVGLQKRRDEGIAAKKNQQQRTWAGAGVDVASTSVRERKVTVADDDAAAPQHQPLGSFEQSESLVIDE